MWRILNGDFAHLRYPMQKDQMDRWFRMVDAEKDKRQKRQDMNDRQERGTGKLYGK